jgi:hypothetical protein
LFLEKRTSVHWSKKAGLNLGLSAVPQFGKHVAAEHLTALSRAMKPGSEP